MRLNRLDLNLLVALDALLSERSITRAAERIHLSQPAMSGALARLREVFEDELLVRVGAKMMPTPLGESLEAPVKNILMQIQATVDRRLEFNASESERRFRFILSDYTASSLMTHVVRRIARSAPRVQLEIISPTLNPLAHLENGTVDLLVMPERMLSTEHPSKHLFVEKFACVGWKENPLLAGELSLNAYLNAGHVTVNFGSHKNESQDQVILREKFGITPRIEVITPSFALIPEFVVGTNRIATTYLQLAKNWASIYPIKLAELPVDMPHIKWGVQWHKFRDLDPAIQWMNDQLAQAAKENF